MSPQTSTVSLYPPGGYGARMPVRFSAGPDRFHLHPAPLLGQHNHELLAEIGLSDAEIAALEADSVIGHAPGSAKRAANR